MKVTEQTRSLIINGLRSKGMTQTFFAESLKYSRSWVSKLLKGDIPNLSAEQIESIDDLLSIELEPIVFKEGAVSPIALRLSHVADTHPEMTSLIEQFTTTVERATNKSLPYIPTEDLVAFGEEMVRAAHEDPGKPGKVGRIGVVMMAEILDKLNAPQEECACDTLPMRGCVAAGSPVYVDDVDETVCVSKEYPEGAYALQVCGSSQDDGTDRAILDGSTIVVVPTGEFYTPKEGELYIVSDGNGSTLKEIKGKKLVSRNPKHKDFSPLEDARIQAKFIEVLES